MIVVFFLFTLTAAAQSGLFAGGGIGVSTLSGSAKSQIGAGSTAVSLYDPKNGLLAHGFAGGHIWEYVALQGVWSWNRNRLTLVSAADGPGGSSRYEQLRESSQHNLGVDALLYFRPRRSFVRPYMSVGLGLMRFESAGARAVVAEGSLPLPPSRFAATKPGLRAAAGIDLLLPSGWGFRYAFLETISGNPVSPWLAPPAGARIMNFQNTFALIRYFGR